MKTFKKGLVLGKFYPPHLGHGLLINNSIDFCQNLTVLVCGWPSDNMPLNDRGRAVVNWLKNSKSGDIFIDLVDQKSCGLPDQPTGPGDEEFWKKWINFLTDEYGPFDAVFTSDAYGEELAHRLSAQWIPVDPERQIFAISGTAVRSNIFKYWNMLLPEFKQYVSEKIAIVGPESCGKSTLAKHLADHFNGSYIPEYGRTLYELKRSMGQKLNAQDFSNIAVMQQSQVNFAAKHSHVVISDTEILTTAIYSKDYLKNNDKFIELLYSFDENKFGLYLLLEPTVPWIDDGTRIQHDEKARMAFFKCFKKYLINSGVNYAIISGDNYTDRTNEAVTLVENYLNARVAHYADHKIGS